MTLFRAAFVSAPLLLVASASAQTTTIVRLGSMGYTQSVSFDGGFEEPVMVAQDEQPATEGEAPKPSAKPSARQEKLKKLEYDRRPSAVLAAWANPKKPAAEDAKPAGSAPEESAGSAAVEAPSSGGSQAGAVVVLPPATGGAVTVQGVALTPLTVFSGSSAAASTTAATSTAPATSTAAVETAAPLDEEARLKAEKEAEKEAQKKAESEAKKKKSAEEAAQKAAEAKQIEAEMSALARNVTLGDWAAVKAYYGTLTEDERKAGFERMLQSLQQGPQKKPNVPQQGQPYLEKNRFSPADVLGLADARCAKLEKAELDKLGAILRQALDQGHQIDGFLAEIAPRVGSDGFALDRRQLALILTAANELVRVGDWLPPFEEAEKANDREGMNLLSRHYLAQYARELKTEWLVKAWRVTQSALAAGDVSEEAKKEALERAVDIAPKIQKDLGAAWLDQSFTERPERGMEILAAICTSASQALAAKPMDVEGRTRLLELQTTAAKALLAAAPERADSWSRELTMLAHNWLREAQVTYQFDRSTSLGPRMQRDNYGNFFYWDPDNQQFQGNTPQTVKIAKILEIRPDAAWLARVEPTLRPKIDMVSAQLLLKVSEEAKAFPYIEGLAADYPKPTKELVDEFLRVWAKNHDPNQSQSRSNYVYFYGFEERANSIPLTRSKQERNLRELGEWLTRLRKLPVEIDQQLVANAFSAAHGKAEVYRLETIEQLFGSIDKLDPKTLAALLEQMRVNLAEVWNDPAVQKDAKTNRGQQDIRAEVLRGYELARATVQRAIAAQPKSWRLVLVQGSLEHDENDYRATLQKDTEFTSRRKDALATLERAANLYASGVEELERDEETTEAYVTWFYAALGAVDLKHVTHERQLASAEIPKIAAALRALPGERSERHVASFANAIFTRMGSAAPAVKYRYVREGLAIVGDNDLAAEAKKLYDYYQDLVTEIQLRATIDGTDRVGHGTPFGLRIDIRHTGAIERESGGFSKYLQNQNAGNFGYNYGRPPEDYRDKFEEVARVALNEHFEVLSVTFNEPNARSKADPEYGWRVTPYAYILLKARGAQIDRVPPLRLDLDFLDTSGYAVLPIESSIVPMDARDPIGDARPFDKLSLTQTLDERQAKDGKLLLEVKANAHGLLPPLADLLDVSPAGFDVVKTEDRGLSVVKLEEEGSTIAAERLWTVQLKAKEGQAALPKTFTFPTPKVETVTQERFRYVDADLASVEPTVSLEQTYGKPSRTWIAWTIGVLAALVGGLWLLRRTAKPVVAKPSRFQVPESPTPFNVIGLLRDIQRNDGLAPEARTSLASDIDRLERHYFGDQRAEAPDLHGVARDWVARAR
ncbi:MAG: hypothetical protein NTY35_09310 [Planctomycetota bacterium]|nr:hypothetical protein [Planctomycetota bacterium]